MSTTSGSRSSWWERSALTATMTIVFAGVTVSSPALPLYQARWDLSVAITTVVFVVYVGGVALALVALGQLADVFGFPLVLALATLTCTGATVLALVVDSLSGLLVARTFQGLAVGMIPGATSAALAATGISAASAARLLAVATTTGIAGGLLVGGVAAEHGTTAVWVTYLVLLAPVTARALLRLVAAGRPTAVRAWRLERPFVPRQSRTTFGIALAATSAAFAGMAAFAGLGPQLLGSGHASALLLGAVVAAVAYLVSGVSQLVSAGRVAGTRVAGLVLAAGLAALALAVHLSNVWLLLTAATLVGAGNGVLFPITLAIVNRLAPSGRRAGTVSTYYLAMYSGVAFPLLALGALADVTSLDAAVLMFCVAVGAAALTLTNLGIRSPFEHHSPAH